MANIKVGHLIKGRISFEFSQRPMVDELTIDHVRLVKAHKETVCVMMCMGKDVMDWFRKELGHNYAAFLAGNFTLAQIEEEIAVAA